MQRKCPPSSDRSATRASPGLYAALGLSTCLTISAALHACSSDGGGSDDAGAGGDGGTAGGMPGLQGGVQGGGDGGSGSPGGGGDVGGGDGGTIGAGDGGAGQGGMDSGQPGGNPGGGDGGNAEAGVGGGSDAASGDDGGGTSGKTECKAPKPNATVGNACKNSAPPNVKLTPVVTGLALPVYVTQAPGDKTRLYVVEQRGRIKVVRNGAIEPTPFLDIVSKVADGGPAEEQGLLGLAFDPNYATTGRFWVKYSKAGTQRGDDTVAMFTATPGGTADAASEKILTQISVPHPDAIRNHNGGMLAFGPDGCLYIAYGDGGGSGDPMGRGQDITDVFGSLLRIDVENFPTAAPGNLTGNNANPHVWNYGLRNPWRFSFDRTTGDLYIGDVGQNAWEEVDVEPAGVGGRNYGWDVVEGKGHCHPSGNTCNQTGMTLPAVEYPNPPNPGQASVIGGYVYRGSAIPGMVGRYLYADSYSRDLKSFVYSGETAGVPQVCDEASLNIDAPGTVFSFGEDLDGELYLTTAEGGLYKFEPG